MSLSQQVSPIAHGRRMSYSYVRRRGEIYCFIGKCTDCVRYARMLKTCLRWVHEIKETYSSAASPLCPFQMTVTPPTQPRSMASTVPPIFSSIHASNSSNNFIARPPSSFSAFLPGHIAFSCIPTKFTFRPGTEPVDEDGSFMTKSTVHVSSR